MVFFLYKSKNNHRMDKNREIVYNQKSLKEEKTKMENTYQETMFLLKKYHILANKSLGQNFLINDEVINKTIEQAQIGEEDLVIEIGPGLGTLTKHLLEKAKRVVAIELDTRMLTILKDRFSLYTNLEIIHQDVLKVNLQEVIQNERENYQIDKVKIVANLPYYITTPIIMKLLEDHLEVESITVMVQKEVAKRLTAMPGSKLCGAITYAISYYCEPYEIVEVPKDSFIPAPEVSSEVIQLVLRKELPVDLKNEKLFFQIIRLAFMQRRKTFINAITNSGFIEKEKIKEVLNQLSIGEKVRGEDLTLEQFAQIANLCSK